MQTSDTALRSSNADDCAPQQDEASGASAHEAPRAVTLRAFALAAVASRIACGEQSLSESLEARFLLANLEAVAQAGARWFDALPAYLDQPDFIDAPLIELAGELGLTLVEMLAVSIAAAVEDDMVVGRALAFLQAPVGGSRPTVGLLAASLSDVAFPGLRASDILASGAAMRSGLLNLLAESAPLPERPVSVPLHLCLALKGHDGAYPGAAIGMNEAIEVPLPLSIARECERQAAGLASSQRTLILRAGSMTEGKSVASLIANHLHRRALFLETENAVGLGPWLILRQLLPVFCFELGPGERKTLPAIPQYQGPALALCGPDGSIEAANGAALVWALPVPARQEREQLWEAALGDCELARELARNHRHGSGRIAQLGRLAHHRGVLNGRARPAFEDVLAASWTGEGAGLDSLAQPLTEAITDEALVMTEGLRRELETLLLRCRVRDGLVDGLGASATARYRPGVRALLVGQSGTGKTLAAGWLATKLGIPLYRVDLASVTSKYIGETEKNLAQLLARAEQAEVLLLFDEADSLFGKRTEIKEANDRFANAQTNYLLQRIEYFDGVVLLTSNSRARFDSAFTRRLDMIIDFPAPGPEQRRAMWQSHLGTAHGLTQKDLNQLAATADLCGGNIRNVVLMAAVLAQKHQRPIEYADVVEGLLGEYKKLGRQMPVDLKLNR